MEEVLTKLEATEIGQSDKTSFDVLYKNWGRDDGQEQRRRDLLDTQKSNRFRNVDTFRGIMDLVNTLEQGHLFNKDSKTARYRPTIQVAGFNRVLYKEVLMLSEWMTEKPSDFEENWLVMPCPKGVRTLVVATFGTTKVFTKYGHFMFECRTTLPGGSPGGPRAKCCCVLDCFYYKNNDTMYVADILAWNSQPMTDGECEFRYFWLKMHLQDLPGVGVLSKKNKLIFKLLEKTPCDRTSLNSLLSAYPLFKIADPGLDGLLFYHKQANYVSGQTPLAVWLFPFMVPEVLGQDITISPSYMLEKPVSYTTQAEFITQFESKYAKKNGKLRPKKQNQNAMDTADSEKKEDATSENRESKTESMESETVPDTSTITEATSNTDAPNTDSTKNEKNKNKKSKAVDETMSVSKDAPQTESNPADAMEADNADLSKK